MTTEERWQLMFVIPPERVVGALLTTTPPDTVMRLIDGLPDDARFVRMFVDDRTQDLCIVLEHPSFKAKYEAHGMNHQWGAPLCSPAPFMTLYSGKDVAQLLAPQADGDGAKGGNRMTTEELRALDKEIAEKLMGQTWQGGKDADSYKLNPGGRRA